MKMLQNIKIVTVVTSIFKQNWEGSDLTPVIYAAEKKLLIPKNNYFSVLETSQTLGVE